MMEENRGCPLCDSMNTSIAYEVDNYRIVKCHVCKLVYLANPPSDKKLYDHYYTDFKFDPNEYRNDSRNSSLAEQWSLNTQRINILKKLKPEGSLLDIGCGRGFFLKTATEAGYQAKGIDIAPAAIEFASSTLHMQANVSTISEIKAKKQQFHIITMWHVLEHFADPYTALGIVKDLLLKEGICIIEVPNLQSLKFTLSKKKWSGGNHPQYHRTFFTASTLRHALLISGFSRAERLKLSYNIPGRNYFYEGIKKGLNLVARDAFIAYAAWK